MTIIGKSQVVINVPRAKKGQWVAASRGQGLKLTDWLIERIDAPEVNQDGGDFDGFMLRIGAFYPFERYVLALPDDDAQALYMQLRALDTQQDVPVASIKIAKTYLAKRCSIADGTADHDLFHHLNVDAMAYFGGNKWLTHADLLQACALAYGLEETH